MRQLHQKSFTQRIITTINRNSPWYEFIPGTEEEFKEMMTFIVSNQLTKNAALRIASINGLILRHQLKIKTVTTHTTNEEMVDVYWQLYSLNYIMIGYSTSKSIGPQIFAVQQQEREAHRVQ